jgi:indolepyruvate ferredoxin oxidoreductase, beta subunit
MIYNILLVGIGGQGIVTLSKILATAAMAKGFRVIVTQKKGLAQRGGSVDAQIRIGEVYSPQIAKYSSDSLLSMDVNETFKYIDYINKDTILVINTKLNNNRSLSSLSEKEKIQRGKIEQLQKSLKDNLFLVDANLTAKQEGMDRAANLYLLGILFGIDKKMNRLLKNDDIEDSLSKNISKNVELNKNIFIKGFRFSESIK